MSSKKIGQFLTFIGLFGGIISLSIDWMGFGDGRFGVSQLLGGLVSIGFITSGLLMFFQFTDRKINLHDAILFSLDKVLNLPINFWVFGGFFVAYVLFFIFPVFFNNQRAMWYFKGYIPHMTPIGLDNIDILHYIRNWLVHGQSPYSDQYVLYPPLGLLVLAPLLLLDYPAHYFVITAITLLLHIAAVYSASTIAHKKQNTTLLAALFASSLFSYGFQFELERGQFNVIAHSLSLIAVFLFHKKDAYRYPAYLLFTLGVQMKIYPIFLIVMFVKDWRDLKSDLTKIIGLLLFNFSLLFVAGYSIFFDFFTSATARQNYGGSWDGNHALKAFVEQLYVDGYGLIKPETLVLLRQYHSAVEIFLLAILGACIIFIILQSYTQNKKGFNATLLLLCTVCALVIPSHSNDYKLSIITIPMALFWLEVPDSARRMKKIAMIVLVFFSSLAYWSIQYPFIVRPEYLNRSFPALFLIALVATILSFTLERESTQNLERT